MKSSSGVELPKSNDTEIQYKVVISALFVSVGFKSKPYVQQHRSAGFVQGSFTILTLLFGWWYVFGLEGVVNSVAAIYGKLRSSHTFTLRELIMKGQRAERSPTSSREPQSLREFVERKRSERAFPPPTVNGEREPQSLREFVERKRSEKANRNQS
jgi:hypothetical protein